MLSVGTLVAGLRLDKGSFDNDVDQSERKFGDLATAATATGAAMAAAGAAAEGYARSQADSNRVLARTEIATGLATSELRDMAFSMSDATFAASDAALGMEELVRRGFDTREEFERILPHLDDFADATGKDFPVAIQSANRALVPFGMSLDDVGDQGDHLVRMINQTDVPLGTLERNLGRVPDELQALEFGMHDAAAGIEVFRDRGFSGQESVREFRRAVADSEGDFGRLISNLGVSADEWNAYLEAVEPTPGLMTETAQANNDAATPMQNLTQVVENLAFKYGDFADALGTLSPILMGGGGVIVALGQAAQAKATLASAAARAGTAVRALGTFMMGPWGLAIGAATAAVGLFVTSQARARARVEEVVGTLDEQTGALTDNTEALARNRLQEEGAFQSARDLGISLDDVTQAALGNEGAMRRVSAVLDATTDSTNETIGAAGTYQEEAEGQRDAADNLRSSLGGLADDLDEATGAARLNAEAAAESKDRYLDVEHALNTGMSPAAATLALQNQAAAGSSDDAATAIDGMGDAANDAEREVRSFNDIMREFVGDSMSAEEAASRWYDQLHRLGDGAIEAGGGIDITTEAGRQNRQAARDATSALWGMIDGQIAQGATIEELLPKIHNQVDAFRDVMLQAGLTEDEVDELIDAYNLVPDDIVTEIRADDRASSTIGGIIGQLDRLPRSFNIRGNVTGMTAQQLQGIGLREHGGPVSAGRPYIVGEARPEVFVPEVDGRIVPSVGQFARGGDGASAGGGGTVENHLHVTSDKSPEALFREWTWQTKVGGMADVG